MKKEKPRFFCDNCGNEVSQDAQECSQCGRSFLSVRCPSCGLTGEPKVFDNGCPKCGYTVNAEPKSKEQKAPKKSKTEAEVHSGLPVWVYVVAGGMFIGVVAAIFLHIF